MIEKIRENKKIISLVFIGLITAAMFLIFFYSYLNRDRDWPTNVEKRSMSLGAREIINESRSSSNVLSETNKKDFSNFLLTEGSDFQLQNADITKDGDSSDTNKSRSIGFNGAVVTTFRGKLGLYNSNVTTNGSGANAIYVTGRGASASVNDTEILTTARDSSGLIAANNGTISANHLSVYTRASKSPSVDTVTKDASINVVSTLFETRGSLSPIVNSSGPVVIDRSTGNAYSSPVAILKDTGNVYFKESTIIAAGGGVPDGYSETGVLIYSDEKNGDTQLFSSINSSLNIDKNYPFYNTASMFNIVNTSTVISLSNTSLNFGSGVLAYIKNSNVVINGSGQTLYGNIIMDNESTLELSLKYESSYDLALNNTNIKVFLGINSHIKLLGDTYIGSFTNEDATNSNIDFNGYHLFVNGVEYVK